MDKVTGQSVSTNHNLFEEKGEPKWHRTEVLLLTSLTLTTRPNQLKLWRWGRGRLYNEHVPEGAVLKVDIKVKNKMIIGWT